MSVTINIPMPKTCDDCPLKTWDAGWREYICAAIGIPIMEHGRLGGCPLREESATETAWHDCTFPESGDYPDDDRTVLCSFANFSVPMLGRWQDGAWYQGDMDDTFVQDDLFVDGWWELPVKPEVEG